MVGVSAEAGRTFLPQTSKARFSALLLAVFAAIALAIWRRSGRAKSASASRWERALAALSYQVKPDDPETYVAIAGILGVVAPLTSYLPARRAITAPAFGITSNRI